MAMYQPPKSIKSETPTVTSDKSRPDMGTSASKQAPGLKKFMAEPQGTFGVGRSGGAPTVGSGSDTAGTRPGHEVLGETKLHTGTSLRPGKPSNLYMPPDGPK